MALPLTRRRAARPEVSPGAPRGRRLRPPLRVLLVSRDPASRAVVRSGLERWLDVALAAETGGGLDALRLARDLRPDAVLVDIARLPEPGLAIVRELKAARPETRVVVLTQPGEGLSALVAEASGADRAIDRETFLSALRHAVRVASRSLPKSGRPP